MRTRTNLIINSGAQYFANTVSQNYKGGTVGIVYDRDPSELIKAFGRNGNNAKAISSDKAVKGAFPENIRYLAGYGGLESMRGIRKIAGERLYSLYCLEIGYEPFLPCLPGETPPCGFAENAYFDIDKFDIKDTEKLIYGNLTLLSILTSLLDEAGKGLLFPYRNPVLGSLVKDIKNFLIGKCDAESYLPSLIKLIKAGSEYAYENEAVPLAFSIKKRLGHNIREGIEFFIAYMLFSFTIAFTKWDFFDMLIPAKNLSCVKPGLERLLLARKNEIEELFPSREELKTLAMNYRCMGGTVSGDEADEAFKVLSAEISKTQGFYAIMNNMGLIEGVIGDEGFKKYRTVSF